MKTKEEIKIKFNELQDEYNSLTPIKRNEIRRNNLVQKMIALIWVLPELEELIQS